MRHAILARAMLAREMLAAFAAVALLGTPSAFAADLLRPYHHHYRHHHAEGSLAIFRGDRYCPRDEPSDYRPRTVDEPLCYAARPYGISMHLYDHSTLLDAYRTDEYQGGY